MCLPVTGAVAMMAQVADAPQPLADALHVLADALWPRSKGRVKVTDGVGVLTASPVLCCGLVCVRCGCIIGKDYPYPIVDHTAISKVNMGRMKVRPGGTRQTDHSTVGTSDGHVAGIMLHQLVVMLALGASAVDCAAAPEHMCGLLCCALCR
jgi:hypothetical protein